MYTRGEMCIMYQAHFSFMYTFITKIFVRIVALIWILSGVAAGIVQRGGGGY